MKAIIVISDLHVGSTVGLCPESVPVVDGGTYLPNKFQQTLYLYWRDFWTNFVPKYTKGAKKIVLVSNGDVLDGVHHNTTNILSNSWAVQERAVVQLYNEIPDFLPRRLKIDEKYFVKGTEVHVGPNGESEERIAQTLKATPNEASGVPEYACYQWWITADDVPFQFAHHIGVTSSAAYESSAPMREMIAALVESAQWNKAMPHVIVRSHRHRFIEVPIPSYFGRIKSVITPGFQARTPFSERIDRMRMPHIGGIVFRVEDDRCETLEKLYPLPEPTVTQI